MSRAAKVVTLAVLLFLPGMAAVSPAGAYLPAMPQQVVCPLTGETVEFTGDYASFTSFGRSLDFEPLVMGMLRRSPSKIPQCRDSGLPIYRDFTPAEVDKLRAMVATPAWAERKAANSAAYLVAYVKSSLAEGELSIARSLLQAVWNADQNNQALLVGKALDAWSHVADTRVQHDAEWTAANWLRVELTRQLGEFERADYLLRDFVKISGPDHAPVSDEMIATERQLIAARNPAPAAPRQGPR